MYVYVVVVLLVIEASVTGIVSSTCIAKPSDSLYSISISSIFNLEANWLTAKGVFIFNPTSSTLFSKKLIIVEAPIPSSWLE